MSTALVDTPQHNTKAVSKEGARIRRMFGNIAGRYDLLNRLLSFNMDQRWRRAAVRLSEAKSGDAVLDVCCGTADLALAFDGLVPGLERIVGTDFTYEMLEIAAGKAEDRSLIFGQADTLQLPFPDESFDVCSVGWGIRNVEDLSAGIAEMKRVVRPGGRVVILESTQPKGFLFPALFKFYFSRVMPAIGNLISRSPDKAYSYLHRSVYEFPDADRLQAIMEEVGFARVQYHLKTFGTVAIHIGTK